MKNRSLFPVRHKMVGGTFILAMIVLFDRILISVAKDPIASDLSLSDKQMGWVLSIFALGYAFSKLLGLSYENAAPTAMIGASNHFEVAGN